MTSHVIDFALDRTTKNTVVFQECDKSGNPIERGFQSIGALYIQKRVFNGTTVLPERLSITLNWEK